MRTAKKPSNRRRALLSGLDHLFYLVLVIVIVVLVNVLIKDQGQWRIDLTEEKIYTLTDASVDLVAELPGEVQVKAFFSEGLQAPEHNLAQQVDDILAEYAAHSEGHLSYEMIFPEDEGDEELAAGYGIKKIAIGQQDANQVGLRLVYKGIALVYGERQEVIPKLSAGDNLEYQITKALKNLFMERPRKVALLSGFGGPGASPQLLESVQQAFENLYGKLLVADVVDLSKDAAIPDDVDALVILNVTAPVSEQAKKAIDEFLMKGKSVALFQSPSAADPKMPQLPFRQPLPHGLGAQFEAYGVTLNNDLVLDRERNVVGLGLSSQGLVQVSIPTLPLMTGVNKESVMTTDIDAVVFPFSGSLSLDEAALHEGSVQVTRLIETADSAVAREDTGDLKVEELAVPAEGEEPGPHLVAVTLAGELPSAYDEGATSLSSARLLVVSNGEFLFPSRGGYSEEYAARGGRFFINTMDWLVQDESLIRIRNKGMPRLLEPVDEVTARWLRVANIGGVPLGFTFLGLFWWGWQRSRRTRIRARFEREEAS